MRIRSNGVVLTAVTLMSLVAVVTLPATVITSISPGARAIEGAVGLASVALAIRLARVGLALEAHQVVVREVLSTDRLPRAEVLGLAVEPILSGRLRRLVVVATDGRVIASSWTASRPTDDAWLSQAGWAAQGFGPTQPMVEPTLAAHHRLAVGGAVPVASREPGLTPATVSHPSDGPASRWLGWEAIFVVAAFALPGVAGAIDLLVKHIVTGGGLDEFDLPIKHHPGPSLVVLIIVYATSALVVPIALLLLARTGQSPASLGLQRRGFRRDVIGAVGLLAGVWAANLVIVAPFLLLLGNSLSNPQSNSHVPAYFVIYGGFVAITTAINEEVVVNGYFMTRLAQLGYSPRSSLAISLAARTSYHVYYGLGFLATVPFGYLVTRSFQKRGRLTRPILTHFAYDAILLTVAVLTS
jgi:membrane protease YdiL (CAAX protease family)